jgi:hypothetical protein
MSGSIVPKDPWENILLGGFVFSLGHKFGAAGLSRDAFSPNMLAHTPIDPYLGDFLGKSDFRGFLVEFKRNWAERRSEQKKEKFQFIYGMAGPAETLNCHFLGYGYKTATGNYDLKFGNYFRVIGQTSESDVRCCCLDEFLQGIVEDRIGANSHGFIMYLEDLIERLRIYCASGTNAKADVADLNSALCGAAIFYTQEGFCTVSFSSFTGFAIKMGIKNSIELDTELEKVTTERHRFSLERHGFRIDGPGIEIDDKDRGFKI